MADIKRPNYFTSQFLVERDFNDEQAYHVNMRRRHNRSLHAFGVADGLLVTRAGPTSVLVSPGTAIDRDGREIVLQDARTFPLQTSGNNLDVFLWIAYGEFLDPADKDTQSGLDKFLRTTEKPLLQDAAAAPANDGSVILLARIRLNASGNIESDGSINATVRTLATAKVAPRAIGTDQIADGAVTLAKFANEALPLAVQAANAITVVTDNVQKRVTVGESHSARTDNPHATTAALIDAQGGTNRIVTQINAGTGVISRARVEPELATGLVIFSNVPLNALEQFSNDIDPGLGTGPICVQLSMDDFPANSITLSGDTNFSRNTFMRAEVNRTTGKFRVVVMRSGGSASGVLKVRWYAFKPQVTVADMTISVGVAISPPAPSLAGNVTQVLTATVSNGPQGVTWSGPESGGGSLSGSSSTSTTYTSPGVSGTYHVTATSTADTTKSVTIPIVVNAAITVILTQTSANLIPGQAVTITGDVINTSNKGITWSILNNAGGTLSTTSGSSTTYTAPGAPGTYTVVATSAADTSKKANFTITVVAVSINISVDQNPINANTSTTVRANISPAFADQRANWELQGVGSLSTTQGATTNYTAPSVGASVTVRGTSVADPSKTQTVQITTNNVGGGPGPGPGPGPGKFTAINENFVPEMLESAVPTASAAKTPTTVVSTTAAKPTASATPTAAAPTARAAKAAAPKTTPSTSRPRVFITPKKRAGKAPPESSDE